LISTIDHYFLGFLQLLQRHSPLDIFQIPNFSHI
jgi:hypothetical protein